MIESWVDITPSLLPLTTGHTDQPSKHSVGGISQGGQGVSARSGARRVLSWVLAIASFFLNQIFIWTKLISTNMISFQLPSARSQMALNLKGSMDKVVSP